MTFERVVTILKSLWTDLEFAPRTKQTQRGKKVLRKMSAMQLVVLKKRVCLEQNTSWPGASPWLARDETLGPFHGLVVPFGTSGMVQVDRPLVLVPLVPRRSEDPLLLVPLVPLRSEDPILLVPLVPRTPTRPNLPHLVVPLVLSQLSFLSYFFGFLIAIPFFEKHFWMKSLLQSTIMLERVWITNKFPRKDRRQPWPYTRTHGYILIRV